LIESNCINSVFDRLVPAINANTIESMGGEIVTVALSIAGYIIVLCIVACSKGFRNSKK